MGGKKAPHQKVEPTKENGELEDDSQRRPRTLPTPARADVHQAVGFINEKAHPALYSGSEEIGAYPLQRFFDTDIKIASSEGSHKSVSYAAFCQRGDLAVHPATLSLIVCVAAQEIFSKEKGFDPTGLSYIHNAELAKLPNTDEKICLARKALQSTFTTRLLSEEVKKVREKSGGKGKVVSTVIEKYLGDPVRLFENRSRNDFLSNPDSLRKMRTETRKKLREGALTLKMVQRTEARGERYAALAK